MASTAVSDEEEKMLLAKPGMSAFTKSISMEPESPPGILALSTDSMESPLSSPEGDERDACRKRRTEDQPASTDASDPDDLENSPLREVLCTELASTHLGTPKRARVGSVAAAAAAAVGFFPVGEPIIHEEEVTTATIQEDEQVSSKELLENTIQEDKEDMMSLASAKSFDFGSSDDESQSDEPTATVNMARPFDMALLKESIQTGSEALDRVVGKDVVLIVGKTGTGKSTLIQGLAGKKLRPTIHTTEYSGQRVQKQVFEAEDPLPDFGIGHAKTSKTKAIHSYETQVQQHQQSGGGNSNQTILYLDSPGFEDTDGHEMDIATSVMLSQVAKTSKSLRFCILIHYASLLEDRGGAIRAILKFTRNFVKDFNAEKQCFVFLFTHTNDMKELHDGDSLDLARTYLEEEIVHTIKETKDEDVKMVLAFMRKCLKRKYPFVDVLHPLKTDFVELRKTLETKVKTVKNPTLALNCGLTMASKSKLEGELSALKLRLRHLLTENPVDTVQINDIRETFYYLGKHIEVTEIRESIATCQGFVERHCLNQQVLIGQEIERGTDLEQDFSPRNAETLNTAVRQLLDLNPAFTESQFSDRLEREVAVHYKSLLEKPCTEFRIEVLQLDKLNAWKEVFPMFADLYRTACNRVEADILRQTEIATHLETSGLEDMPNESIDQLISSLCALDSIATYKGSLCQHDLSIDQALGAFGFATEKVGAVLCSWKEDDCAMMDLDEWDAATLHSLASRAKCLEVLHCRLQELAICQDLSSSILSVSLDLEVRLVGHFRDLAAELIELEIPFDNAGLQNLETLKRASCFLGILKGEQWKEIQFCYANVISHTRSSITAKSRELENKTELLSQSAFVDGKQHGLLMVAFDKCIRLDSFFDQKDRFVECCSIKYHHTFEKKIEAVTTKINKMFESLYNSSTDSVEVLASIQEPLTEIRQITEFASTIESNQWSTLLTKVGQQMMLYTEKISVRKDSALADWAAAIEKCSSRKVVLTATRKLHNLLCELEGLLQLEVSNIAAAHLQKDIIDALKSRKHSIMAEINSNGDYSVLAKLLGCVEAFGVWSQTAPHLPNLDFMKQSVSLTVSNDAKKIEVMVANTSSWDEIDLELENFKKAAKVDHFVGGQASSRLGPLLKLREQKEADVDELLENLVAKQDYKCMGELLAPLAESKDQMKRQKFDRYQRSICTSLREQIEDLSRHLSVAVSAKSAIKIAEGIEKLEDAKQEMGKHLKSNLDLFPQIQRLKGKVDDEFNCILDGGVMATERADFVNISTFQHRESLYWNHLSKYLDAKSKQQRQHFVTCCQQARDSVPGYVKKFLESNFTDAVQLLGALSSLKSCSESPDASVSQFGILYHKIVKGLLEKTNERLQNVDNLVCDTRCYNAGMPVLQALVRQLEGGLKKHINQADLELNCEEKLEIWKEEQQKHDYEMDFGGQDAEVKLQSWAEKLDKLQSPSTIRILKVALIGGTTYENERVKLQDKVTGLFADAKSALQGRDFKRLKECIAILGLVKEKVTKHCKRVAKDLNDLRDRSLCAFLDLAGEMKEALEEARLNQCEGYFVDFKGFLMCVPHVLENVEATTAYALVNQLVYEVLSKQVKQLASLTSMEAVSFDFLKLKSVVEETRSFGAFVTDNFTLLQEELKGNRGGQDEWLAKISILSHKHFSDGRDLALLKSFAILGVIPSSSAQEIKRAFHIKARECHPDKRRQDCEADIDMDVNAEFRKVKEASDELLSAAQAREGCQSKPFDILLRSVGRLLREKVREFQSEQRYASIKELLFNLASLPELDNLVSPALDSRNTRKDIIEIVKSHVGKVKVEVDSNWSSRSYRLLNDNISDLKMMELHYKSYTDIFPTSWNTGIIQTVEDQITSLGNKARLYLSDKRTAKENEDEFRRCFIEMGSVLVELPTFKDYTKRTMCDVLEACLHSEWGYSYLFELGLSLQRGEGDQSDDEARVAHIILAEFSHFKEVMTMAWNTETTQKPVEDTVKGINGQDLFTHNTLPIDRTALLESFEAYETMYKQLLGEYIRPNADLVTLVEKTQAMCDSLKPISCEGGWGQPAKQKLPLVLAGVFALFTVCKSGESYNRMEGSEEATKLGDKILMKPHNIQVLTLLYMFGCGNPSCLSLESQLLQIRTGEGKSMILGAAAAVLGLLGYSVRCVCYSDYLSSRDFALFKDVFVLFGLEEFVKYSKITSLSEDTTGAKGDIRGLTDSLLHGRIDRDPRNTKENATQKKAAVSRRLRSSPAHAIEETVGRRTRSSDCRQGSLARKTRSSTMKASGNDLHSGRTDLGGLQNATQSIERCADYKEEILLVDEVDVFFGSDFYGQTYNQVAQLREPEVADILKLIWAGYKQGGRRQRLADIKCLESYKRLVRKVRGFDFMVDNEISLMLDQVGRVDEEPYFLDSNDRIGYKVMDSVSFNVTYGYRTVFAYLKESDRGNLIQNDLTLQKVLCMHVSCGQFSYANIKPTKILGVSGTLEAMGKFERNVLAEYGIGKFLFMPSVYGKSNFTFDRAGEGIFIESGQSDFYHRLSSEITKSTRKKRAVIVFFCDAASLNAFEKSAFYRKLGRQKAKLSEAMDNDEKDFIIKKAATAGQLTICPAVFGRGTDFFCKDQKVLDNGGVHIIQTFLSAAKSEEIQIQGRTARQGKKGTFQMVLLDADLEDFNIDPSNKDKIPKHEWYDWLCRARDMQYDNYCSEIEANLVEATARDEATHKYFDALLESKTLNAQNLFKDIYLAAKKRPMPSSIDIDLALVIDVTGSMGPYVEAARRTIESLLVGRTSIVSKLQVNFPDIEFKLRVATMAYRDIDDHSDQFQESLWRGGSHFTENSRDTCRFLENALKTPSGGFDLAEDHLAAIDKCCKWADWTSSVRFMMLLTDAPAHGMVPLGSSQIANADSYATRHPLGLTAEAIVNRLVSKEIDLFLCSFNPLATAATEEALSKLYLNHPANTEEREITTIAMVEKHACQRGAAELSGGHGQHIIFVLDQSGSMSHNWAGVVCAYKNYIDRRMQNQSQSDLVSVIQFDGASTVAVHAMPIGLAPTNLRFSGGGTCYSPAAADAYRVAIASPSSHAPVVVFMSDGMTSQRDAENAANTFLMLNHEIRKGRGHDLDLHVIAFGVGLDNSQLRRIAESSPQGKIYTSADTAELSRIFVDIAQSNQDVSKVLEAEIGRRIGDAVSDKLSMEYLG